MSLSMSSPPPPSSIPTYDFNLHIPQQPQQQHQNSHSSSSSLSNLSPSIIITLLILSATIILTTCLFLICRHFHRFSSFFRCRRSQRTVFLSSHHHTQHPNTNPTNSLPNPNNSSALIDSLPLFSYSSVTRRSSSSSDGNDCAVCLSQFKAHDQLRLLPLCCHAFHAQCVDTWLVSNHTCPLCRSNVYASEADMASILNTANADRGTDNNSFRLEIGSISERQAAGTSSDPFDARRSYSIGSFDYIVDGESEVAVVSNSDKEETNAAVAAAQYFYESSLAGDVGSGRSWLGEYMDRLSATVSSRAASFRSSRRYFTGSSRRSEVAGLGEWELDSSRVGEEISEIFRWASGV